MHFSLADDWNNLGGNLCPSSFPSIFRRQNVYHIFASNADNSLGYAKCNASSCTSPLSWTNLGGNISGSPTGTYIKDTQFYVFGVQNNEPNARMLWINSTDAGVTWKAWQEMPSAMPMFPGHSSSSASNHFNHIVHVLLTRDQLAWRYYFYGAESANPWNMLRISRNSFDSILCMGWNNESHVDLNDRHFDVFGIGTDGVLYQNMWDFGGQSWSSVMKKAGLTELTGAALFGTVDPGSNAATDARLRMFVVYPDGTIYQATRTFNSRLNFMTSDDWEVLPNISLDGTKLCRRPVGYSNSGNVTLFSIGNDGVLYSTSFSASPP